MLRPNASTFGASNKNRNLFKMFPTSLKMEIFCQCSRKTGTFTCSGVQSGRCQQQRHLFFRTVVIVLCGQKKAHLFVCLSVYDAIKMANYFHSF